MKNEKEVEILAQELADNYVKVDDYEHVRLVGRVKEDFMRLAEFVLSKYKCVSTRSSVEESKHKAQELVQLDEKSWKEAVNILESEILQRIRNKHPGMGQFYNHPEDVVNWTAKLLYEKFGQPKPREYLMCSKHDVGIMPNRLCGYCELERMSIPKPREIYLEEIQSVILKVDPRFELLGGHTKLA